MGGEGFRGKGSGFHIQGYACRVLSVGSRGNCFRVWGLRLRVFLGLRV